MELWIIWGVITISSLLITGFTAGIGWGLFISICSGLILRLWSNYKWDQYIEWGKQGFPRNNAYLEWMLCKCTRRNMRRWYKSNKYIKISFKEFQKEFENNPSHYYLNPSWVVFDDGNNKSAVIGFRREDLFRYFLFRRNYLLNQRNRLF